MADALHSIRNLAFEEHLVRVFIRDGAPWFVAADVCRVLGIQNPSKAVEKLDEDEKGLTSSYTLGGQQELLTVSEGGLFTLILRCRAAMTRGTAPWRFRKWVTGEVLPQIHRNGAYGQPSSDDTAPAFDVDSASVAALRARIDLVREARSLFGPGRAVALWGRLGLPEVPPPFAAAPLLDAYACLRRILEWVPEGMLIGVVRDAIELALDDNEEMRISLKSVGIRVILDGPEEGFVVANRSPALHELFDGTEWSGFLWHRALKRLPGAIPRVGPFRFDTPFNSRGVFLPAGYLDPAALARSGGPEGSASPGFHQKSLP